MFRYLFVLILLIFSFSIFAGSIETSTHKQFLGGQTFRNYVKNPGAEKNTAYVTASGDITVTRSTSTPFEGDASFVLDNELTSDYAEWSLDTFQAGVLYQNCLLSFTYSGDGANRTVSVYRNSATVASDTMINTSEATRVFINFPCGDGSNATTVRITATASPEDSLKVDGLYVGLADNIANISQAQFWGAVIWPGTTNCVWSRTSNATFGAFSADSDCTLPVGSNIIGMASAPATKVPGIVLNNLPEGYYRFEAIGAFFSNDTGICSFRFSDGTNSSTANVISGQPNAEDMPVITGWIKYDSPQSSVTVNIQATGSLGNIQCNIAASAATTVPLQINVWRYPTSREVGIRPDTINWRVDANISGANFDLGSSDQTSYTGMTNGSMTLTNNTGEGVLTAQIPCSTTVAPSGTTCSSGTESNGVAFTVPRPGDVLACVSFGHTISNSASSTVVSAFQIVETPTNAQTISQQGKSRISSQYSALSSIANLPHRLCGTFSFSSAGQKVLRLFYEQDITNTPTANLVIADADANIGQRDIHWEVYPISQIRPAPIFTGSVTSSSNQAERVEYMKFTCSGTSSIGYTSISGATIGNVSSGKCLISIPEGIFTDQIVGVQNLDVSSTTSDYTLYTSSGSQLGINVGCYDNGGAANCSSWTGSLLMMGPR